MSEQADRGTRAVVAPMQSGLASSASFGVAAPLGAVSRKVRLRAEQTSLEREGASTLLLRTALPGRVTLERRGVGGTWDTLESRPAARGGRTRLELPQVAGASGPPGAYRVRFSPKNANLTAWVSYPFDA